MSEFEAYASVNPEAMVGVSNASQFADVDWECSLQGRLEDVVHYGLAVLPYEELCSLAIEKASPKAWAMRELQRHLRGLLGRDLDLRYTDTVSQGSRDLFMSAALSYIIHTTIASV